MGRGRPRLDITNTERYVRALDYAKQYYLKHRRAMINATREGYIRRKMQNPLAHLPFYNIRIFEEAIM